MAVLAGVKRGLEMHGGRGGSMGADLIDPAAVVQVSLQIEGDVLFSAFSLTERSLTNSFIQNQSSLTPLIFPAKTIHAPHCWKLSASIAFITCQVQFVRTAHATLA